MAAGGNRLDPGGDLAALSLVPGRSESHQLHDWLRNEIIVCQIGPGTALSGACLCHHFGVSRQPVRETLAHLTKQCLVRIFPQRGSVDRHVELPATNITACAFGGPDRQTLYVTAATKQPSDNELGNPGEGALLALDVGVAGPRSYRFEV